MWKYLLIAFSLLPILSVSTTAEARPNIVLIMVDDFGYECLGCNGSLSYKTPVIDELAKTGLRFTHCYSQPLCTPSRVQIMTGKYNFRNYQAFGWLDPKETTFGHLLKQAGYRTCIAGKWQLNGLSYQLPGYDDNLRPQQAGFDEYCLWQLTQPKSKGERYADPLVECRGEKATVREGGYGPDAFADFITEFIEQNQQKPFFVYYPMVLTHDPFVPTPDSAAWNRNRNKRDKKFFADMVAYTDKSVGKIVAKLDELGLRENTLIIFTGDNGSPRQITTETASGTIKGGKGLTIDSGCHVPLVVNWKGTAIEGFFSNDLIDFTDFLPTLLEAAETKPSAGSCSTDGVFCRKYAEKKVIPATGCSAITIRFGEISNRTASRGIISTNCIATAGCSTLKRTPSNSHRCRKKQHPQFVRNFSQPSIRSRPGNR